MTLNLHAWGDPAAAPLLCLHGLTAHGGRFRRLAEERLARRFHVLAPDLRGHGRSDPEPPWDLDAHVDDVLAIAPPGPLPWLGHSFGARILLELAARAPERVGRIALLDPALSVLPHVALALAEHECSRGSFASPEEALAALAASPRYEHSPHADLEAEAAEHLERVRAGEYRFRYVRAAAVAAWSELTREPPPPPPVPTLLVVAAESYLVRDDQREALEAALGDLLEVVEVPGGHTVYWDAFEPTAAALERFLAY
jgi:lipase